MKGQTRKQAIAKCKALIADIRKNKYLEKECLKLIESGGVPLDEYPDNYVLARLILKVALENNANQYSPMNKEQEKIARNLRYF